MSVLRIHGQFDHEFLGSRYCFVGQAFDPPSDRFQHGRLPDLLVRDRPGLPAMWQQFLETQEFAYGLVLCGSAADVLNF